MSYVIERNDASARGFVVQVPGVASKYFSITRYGNRVAAQYAALLYRDAVLKKTGRTGPREFRARSTRNTSGVVGVMRMKYTGSQTKNGKKYYSKKDMWVAFWTVNGKAYQKRYSVMKYGDAGAKRLAIIAREQGLAGVVVK